ncbi:hypothetical protein A2630_00440 [Candidatus Woesebacteria bacterium RIFCSPHIGHO2_01_FULL_44_10]|uniref:Tetratricopeptide repeat protein n=1 Tax=Candidatus Woesebacteria bacterium RIFCSPLOWO2_01_FULL_44_14 TaxID=1802525 RepID=A0A1F8C1S0_9BACT|nr:MAG: hypothetical protein A2630_00440 [Candidatus Woesebacteria bacterium RIFCSPHIGHO2_01_FULL_44_10]OGM53723.1 MAG: hypothetical protein A3F62_03605 [Candidatus Woesebacteria bacterium RIFCSPHIGHO2_12_FULL_44_11]OGM70070.1 MAG: hypothetical protein A2975_03270 [Candidatus Woesebacteria bacterium RIFCSPLOWO2_01_FULL_44_14]
MSSKLIKIFFFFILALTLFNLISSFRPPRQIVLGQQVDLENQKAFWEDMIFKYPTYRQAWEELAKVEEKLGNTKEAQEAADTAKQISPNSP